MPIFQKLMALLDAQQRARAVLVLVLMLVGMVLEMLGIGLVLPVMGLMTSPELLSRYPIAHAFIDMLGNKNEQQLVVWGIAALAIVYGLKNIYLAVLAWTQSRFIFGLHACLSQKLFANYLRKPYVFHLRHNSAQLIRNVTTEVNLFTNAMQAFMMLATELSVLAGVSALLLYVEPKGTIAAVILLGLAAATFYWVVRKRLTHWGKERQYHDGKRIQLVQEGLGSIKDIKVLGRAADFLAAYRVHNHGNARVLQHQYFLQQLPRLWLEVLAMAGLAVVVLMMVGHGSSPALMLPMVGLFGAAAFRLMPSVNRCMNSLQSTRFAVPSINILYHELSGYIESDAPQVASTQQSFRHEIKLDCVSYCYPGAEKNALENINLVIHRGESIGVVGASGAGKSTLVDIILGLITPSGGEVSADNTDIHSQLRNWQSQIGYVPQSIYLTDDSLRRNVAFGLAEKDIREDAIWRALRSAQLDEFVKGLPEGLETAVGERGVRLSGGQRQRIGIARALYHDPAVLILDEATSSLDTATESGVMEAVRAMQGEKTIVIITHRLSTVEHCDRLIRLDAGKIVAQNDIGLPLVSRDNGA